MAKDKKVTGKLTDAERDAEDNEQGRGPSRDLPDASVQPELSTDDPDIDPEDPSASPGVGERTKAPVQAPHFNALVDIFRVLPCQVQPVNSKDWYTVTGTEVVDGEIVLVTAEGKQLRGRDIGDPVLTRTNDPDANLLH